MFAKCSQTPSLLKYTATGYEVWPSQFIHQERQQQVFKQKCHVVAFSFTERDTHTSRGDPWHDCLWHVALASLSWQWCRSCDSGEVGSWLWILGFSLQYHWRGQIISFGYQWERRMASDPTNSTWFDSYSPLYSSSLVCVHGVEVWRE